MGVHRVSRLALVALVFASLSIAPLLQAQSASAGVAGKWVGVMDIVAPDGAVDPGNAYFSFTQNGDHVAGGAGDSATHLSPVSGGIVTGSALSFDVVVNPQLTVKFTLTREGDHLKGSATGLPSDAGSKIVVDVARADDAWHGAAAVAHAPDRLFENVAEQDRRLFDAYNTCDLATMGAMVSDDLEFYHDKTGLAVGKAVFLESIKNNICGKVHRTLTPGTLEVHRLNHYGAVEIGSHRFDHPGHEDQGVGEAKFVTIWQFKDGTWKVTRVISYDHAPAKQ